MTRGFPDWQPFDLDPGDDAPLELSGMRGSALVILAAPAVDESGWGVRAAARIAAHRARGARGRGTERSARLLLADLDIEHPRLHMELGADNGEGVSDAFLYGASLQRVTRPVDAGFLFMPAGTAVADPADVLENERWPPILTGFERAGAELFLFVPWDCPGRDAMLSLARNMILLAEAGEVESLSLPDVEGLRLGAVLGPPSENGEAADGPDVEEDEIEETSETEGDAEEPIVAAAAVENVVDLPRAAADVEAPAGSEVAPPPSGTTRQSLALNRSPEEFDRLFTGEGDPERIALSQVVFVSAPVDRSAGWEPVTLQTEDVNRRSRRFVILIAVLVALGALALAAGLVGLISIPGVPVLAAFETPAGTRSVASPVAVVEAHRSTPGGSEADALPPYSLAVASYRELEPALELAAALEGTDGLFVVLAPVRVGDLAWHRVLVGPLDDPASAEALRTRLSGASRLDGSGWFVRATPLAFEVVADASAEEAVARRDELLAAGVPAYVLEASGTSASPRSPGDGVARYRVYVGAYADETEAAHARSLLQDRGVASAALVRRVGRIPSSMSFSPAG